MDPGSKTIKVRGSRDLNSPQKLYVWVFRTQRLVSSFPLWRPNEFKDNGGWGGGGGEEEVS